MCNKYLHRVYHIPWTGSDYSMLSEHTIYYKLFTAVAAVTKKSRDDAKRTRGSRANTYSRSFNDNSDREYTEDTLRTSSRPSRDSEIERSLPLCLFFFCFANIAWIDFLNRFLEINGIAIFSQFIITTHSFS